LHSSEFLSPAPVSDADVCIASSNIYI
jgi:hypothetical protein